MAISWNLERIKAHRVWDTCRGTGVRISVLDTGVDRNHPALAHNIKASLNIISGAGEGEDGSGHGTYVAGIIAADNKGEEKVSVAPEANLYCLKVLEDDILITGKPTGPWTSFAAPHVTGVAALVLSVNRSIASDRLRQILRDTAENLGLPATQQGAGVVNAVAATEQAKELTV